MAHRKIHFFVAVSLLFLALVADAYQIGSVAKNREIQEALLLPNIVKGKKVYDENGNFKGCEVPGDNCWIVYSLLGDVTLSNEGIHLQ